MKNFKLINNITGWSVFLISLIVYTLTVEPSASLWDCGEFIAAANKLEIGHPPGAPLFMLMGRGASMFAGSPQTVAWWVNMVSVVASAFTILFLYWTIVLLGQKLIDKDEEGNYPTIQQLALIGASVIGSLAFTFSDSFWFSATEAEVYATSAFFTAFVFWAILKWETVADEPGSDRWIILIAYMVGLSIGVHLLNLLAIPALGFIYYFKKYENPSLLGGVITFILSSIIVSFIQTGVIIGLPSIMEWMELQMVYKGGMGIHTGIIVFLILLIGGLVAAIVVTHIKKLRLLNTAFLSLAFILIGYSSYTIIVIRSQYKPPLNENNPGRDVMSLTSFLKREQYGDWSIMYGPQFGAYYSQDRRTEKGEPVYRREGDNYIVYDHDYELILDTNKNFHTLLPRMSRFDKKDDYVRWLEANTDWTQNPKDVVNEQAGVFQYPKPSFGENMQFMFQVQMNNMYWRYFGWNFIGRTGDIKGNTPGATDDADVAWFTDPKGPAPSNEVSKAYNTYFMLPFLLGMLGLFYHYSRWRDTKDALVITLLFFFTGLAIIIYLNAPPLEPRERDYAYAGSYYAFAIEIGIGVLALFQLLRMVLDQSRIALIASVGISTIVPGIMAVQGWDDHDRSGRFFAVDSAKNLLDVCAPNAVLFTAGDNDTFPLWYLQEVEGYRTDVRVCNLSLLNTTWYAEQMKLKAYDSEPLPIKVPYEVLAPETFNMQSIPKQYADFDGHYTRNEAVNAEVFIDLLDKGDKRLKYQGVDTLWYLPSRKLKINLDSAALMKADWIPEIAKKNASNQMMWNLPYTLDKKSVMIMDLIVNNARDGWKRPIYFSTTMGGRYFMNLQNYMQQEGLAYRLLPFKPVLDRNIPAQHKQYMKNYPYYINTDVSAEKLLGTVWRGLDDESIFYDVPHKILPNNVRMIFSRVATQCVQENKIEMARELLNYSVTKIPHKTIPFESSTYQYIRLYMLCAQKDNNYEDALRFTDEMLKVCDSDIEIWKNRYTKYLEEYGAINQEAAQRIQLCWTSFQVAYQYIGEGEEQAAKKAEYKKYLTKHSKFLVQNKLISQDEVDRIMPPEIKEQREQLPDTIAEMLREIQQDTE